MHFSKWNHLSYGLNLNPISVFKISKIKSPSFKLLLSSISSVSCVYLILGLWNILETKVRDLVISFYSNISEKFLSLFHIYIHIQARHTIIHIPTSLYSCPRIQLMYKFWNGIFKNKSDIITPFLPTLSCYFAH